MMVKDRGYISSHVAQPLISYQRLLKREWTITLNSKNEPKLGHARSGVGIIPVGCKNDSLVVSWTIRRVKGVRHVPADVPKSWSEKGESWSTTALAFPICRRRATTFIDPRKDYGLDEWPHGTTIGLSDTGWEMIEVCVRV